MKILIAGDVVPINSNRNIFKSKNVLDYFSDFTSVFTEADLFVANLECPLTSANQKAAKSGSSIKAEPDAIEGIGSINVNLLSMANNHIGDFGGIGVRDTINQLKKHKLSCLGAGENPNEARRPFIHNAKGKTIGVLSYADFEFGMVNEHRPGANPFDTIHAFEDINSTKSQTDYIIVMLHDGKEYYSYPSPQLQKIGRYLIDLGADIVVCQHSHVIGAVENYKAGTIVYGQGNFLFDYRDNRTKEWSSGFFIEINLKEKIDIDYIPFKQNYPGISRLSKQEEEVFRLQLAEQSKHVLDPNFIKASWADLISKQSSTYLSTALGHNSFLAKVLKKTGLYKYLMSKEISLIMLNYIRSRVHRESFREVLEQRIENKNQQ